MPLGTVKSNLRRGLARLRTRWEEVDDADTHDGFERSERRTDGPPGTTRVARPNARTTSSCSRWARPCPTDFERHRGGCAQCRDDLDALTRTPSASDATRARTASTSTPATGRGLDGIGHSRAEPAQAPARDTAVPLAARPRASSPTRRPVAPAPMAHIPGPAAARRRADSDRGGDGEAATAGSLVRSRYAPGRRGRSRCSGRGDRRWLPGRPLGGSAQIHVASNARLAGCPAARPG